ncbi:MAG: twin-arginine translocase subunit TatC [Nitrospinae bacterium]|nr:twin-arginine translocase subunit TatC [Nitrospinota bacterium]
MDDKEITVVEHLEELRRRLIICVVSVILGAGLCYLVVKRIADLLARPVGNLVFLSPTEAFVTYLKLSLISGVFLASPIVLYQLWRFVSVALKGDEKKSLLIFAPFSFILFVGGVVFAYFFILPLGMDFMLGFATDTLRPMISFSSYVSFAGMFLLAFGVVFQLPLVMMFLTKIGIISPKFLRKKRRYAILIIFIVSAILTPPDVITQALMAGPLVVLYEISIILSNFVSPLRIGRPSE